MFSSFTSFSNPLSFLSRNAGPDIDLASVEVHDVETQHDKRSRTLKHLIKLNHANHSILYHNLQFHNHLPHILGSAYLLEAGSEHLNDIYEQEASELEPWKDSPGEISRHDWRDYLSLPEYQRAFVDFFEDELVLNGYDWRKVVDEYLLKGKEPLVNCLIGGLGHPLIHLGYAFELSSRDLAMEALGMTTTCYSFLHRYLDDASYTRTSTYSTSSPLDIFQRVQEDRRFNGIYDRPGEVDLHHLFEKHEDAVLEHWNAWLISNARKQLEDSQHAAVALLVATHKPGSQYDFFLVHLLTTSHAVRIILPLIPAKFHISLVRQWWLLTLSYYIGQLRPAIPLDQIKKYDLQDRDWVWIGKQAVEGRHSKDPHYVKALRAIKEIAKTWGDKEDFYLKAAVKFGAEFSGWGGFE